MFLRLKSYTNKFCSLKKHAIRSISDPQTFDGFQTKLLWKLKILQTMLILKVFFVQVIKKQNYYFVTVLSNISMRQILTNDFLGLQKNMNCVFPLRF